MANVDSMPSGRLTASEWACESPTIVTRAAPPRVGVGGPRPAPGRRPSVAAVEAGGASNVGLGAARGPVERIDRDVAGRRARPPQPAPINGRPPRARPAVRHHRPSAPVRTGSLDEAVAQLGHDDRDGQGDGEPAGRAVGRADEHEDRPVPQVQPVAAPPTATSGGQPRTGAHARSPPGGRRRARRRAPAPTPAAAATGRRSRRSARRPGDARRAPATRRPPPTTSRIGRRRLRRQAAGARRGPPRAPDERRRRAEQQPAGRVNVDRYMKLTRSMPPNTSTGPGPPACSQNVQHHRRPQRAPASSRGDDRWREAGAGQQR